MDVVRYYGAKQDTPDYRDYSKTYSQHEIPSWLLPTADLRKYVNRVYDQGQLSSCTANALCGAYALNLQKQSVTLSKGFQYFNPSRLFLYYNTRDYEGTTDRDSGASIRETIKALNRKGVCDESNWPYNIKKYATKPPMSCYQSAQGNTLCKYERLSQNIDQFRACLNDNCPFVFGFKVYNSFHNSSNGLYGSTSTPTRREMLAQPLGLHAVMAVGYNDTERRIIVANSWGPGWGDNGYFHMPYDFITNPELCCDFWKITFACQRGKPRPKDTKTFPTQTQGGGAGGYGHSSSYSSYGYRGYSSSGGAYTSGGACGYSRKY